MAYIKQRNSRKPAEHFDARRVSCGWTNFQLEGLRIRLPLGSSDLVMMIDEAKNVAAAITKAVTEAEEQAK